MNHQLAFKAHFSAETQYGTRLNRHAFAQKYCDITAAEPPESVFLKNAKIYYICTGFVGAGNPIYKNKDETLALSAFEAFQNNLPQGSYTEVDEATIKVKHAILYLLSDKGITNFNQSVLNNEPLKTSVAKLKLTKDDGTQDPAQIGMALPAYTKAMLVHKQQQEPNREFQNNNIDKYFDVLDMLVETLSEDEIKSKSYSMILTMIIGIVKRGSPSEGKLKNLLDATQMSTNSRPNISAETLRIYWKGLEKHLSPAIVTGMFDQWAGYIPESCIHIRMLVINSKWEGLTGIVTVKETLKKYPDVWEKICCIAAYKGEMEKFKVIVEKVKDSPYQAYGGDMTDVAQSNYPNLMGVASYMMKELDKNRAWSRYRGKNSSFICSGQIENIIRKYNNVDPEAASPEDLERNRELVKSVADINLA